MSTWQQQSAGCGPISIDLDAAKRDDASMVKHLLIAAAAMALPAIASAQDEAPPATVVVAFDLENITPLIAEGTRNRDTGKPVEANDPVRIASISKLIMALATLRLVDEGKVDLDADVSEYLTFAVRPPHHPEAKVTLAQLLSHRSGLRDKAGYVIPLGESLEAKLKDPAAWFADAPPGDAPFEYANIGSPVVATVLEAATGERYDAILKRTVFDPLGIENACVNWIGCTDDIKARAVALYRETGEPARDFPAELNEGCPVPVAEGTECTLDNYVPGTNASVFSPQGGLRIGMVDLAKIGSALIDYQGEIFPNRVMSRAGDAFEDGRNADQEFFCFYGFNMQMIEVSNLYDEDEQLESVPCVDQLFLNGNPWVGHAGEAYGLRSGLWFDMFARRGFVYFTTQVPPRQSAEDEGGFDTREIALMKRAQALLAQQDAISAQ